jgi:hypothetical protein
MDIRKLLNIHQMQPAISHGTGWPVLPERTASWESLDQIKKQLIDKQSKRVHLVSPASIEKLSGPTCLSPISVDETKIASTGGDLCDRKVIQVPSESKMIRRPNEWAMQPELMMAGATYESISNGTHCANQPLNRPVNDFSNPGERALLDLCKPQATDSIQTESTTGRGRRKKARKHRVAALIWERCTAKPRRN